MAGFGVSRRREFMNASDQRPLGMNVASYKTLDAGGASTHASSGSVEFIHPTVNKLANN